MLKRLSVAIPLIAIVILALALPGMTGALFFMLLAALLLWGTTRECYDLIDSSRYSIYETVTLLYGLLLLLFAFNNWHLEAETSFTQYDSICTVAMLLFLLTTLIRKVPNRDNLNRATHAVFVCGAIIWPLIHLPRIYFLNELSGKWLLGYLILITKVADIGAYFIGTGTARLPGGNHKLSKLVSPKKSYEGLAGGIVFSLIFSWGFWKCAGDHLLPLTLFDCLALGVVAPVIGLLGDLSESVLKRVADKKDSGHLPGLGGVLDFLDSLLPMGMVFYYWLMVRKLFA